MAEEKAELCLDIRGLEWGVEAHLKAGDPPLLRGLDLQVKPAEWVALTGPSGVGKTTLLSLSAGLLKPVRGEVTLFGHSVTTTPDAQISRLRSRRVGLIFQGYQLDDGRSVLDNILLPAYFSDGAWSRWRERARHLAEQLEISELLDKVVSVLSGGQRQRVAVARAVVSSPDLILADEPTGALDRNNADLVLGLLSAEASRGVGIVTVSHDGAVIERADRVLTFHEGRLSEVEQ